MEKGKEGLWEPEGTRTNTNTKSQLLWAPEGSQRLNHQPENLHENDQGPLPCIAIVWLGCLFRLLAERAGLSLIRLPARGTFSLVELQVSCLAAT